MARIRSIKPEFFTSSDVVALTPLARLFYVSLWCEADREGRLKWDVVTLKMRYLPGDDCDVEELAEELVERELIAIYEVAGKLYAEIPSFKNHQVINNREAESILPPRVKGASARVKAEGRKEGKGREGDTPLTPQGGEDPPQAKPEKPKRTSAKISLDQFMAECRESGEDAVPPDDPIFEYAERIGLPVEFVGLAWEWFKGRYAEKRQAGVRGWRQTFRNAVEGNWPKYWFRADDGSWLLTTAGKQAELATTVRKGGEA